MTTARKLAQRGEIGGMQHQAIHIAKNMLPGGLQSSLIQQLPELCQRDIAALQQK